MQQLMGRNLGGKYVTLLCSKQLTRLFKRVSFKVIRIAVCIKTKLIQQLLRNLFIVAANTDTK